MKQLQRGFTLIEIVMVIAILGILAAVAIPKYVDLKDEANTSAVQGVAGALASASAINYSSAKAGKSGSVIDTTCSSAEASLTGGALPTGYATGGTFPAACTVGNGSKTATWKATDSN